MQGMERTATIYYSRSSIRVEMIAGIVTATTQVPLNDTADIQIERRSKRPVT